MKQLLLIALLCSGCSGGLVRPAASPDPYCVALDKDHRTWGALAKFSAALAGTGGLATLPIDPDEKTARVTVGVSAAALAAFAAAAIYVEQDAATTWATRCAEEKQP
jgi:hypothetical protein